MEKVKRTKVVDLLKSTAYGSIVNVKGWVRTHRSSKAVDFIALNDGSTINNIQIVVDPSKVDENQLRQITTGACISAVGTLVESQGAGQSVEIQCESIEIYGLCGSDYPMQKKGQSFEYMRQYAHLRLRTNTFGAVMRIRHNMAMAIHTYFHEHGYFYFNTPLITASDCEGAGQMFQVTTKNLYNLKKTEDGIVDPSKVDENQLRQITTGACISAVGTLVESQGAGQSVEIQCESIEIYGLCGSDYPMQKKGQSFEYMRQYAHLRLRTNTFGAVMRIRHNMAMAIHTYFHEHGYFYFNTPLITASDCEGAGQMFQVTTKNLYNLKKTEDGKIDYSDDFFGKQTSLTVSGQLEGELGATALGAIYTFGPTFRAENSNTPRHLAEFWMVEPEVAFLDMDGLMELEEDFIKYCIRWALEHCKDDLAFLNKMIDKGLIARLEGVLNSDFVHLPYTEGIRILQEAIANGKKFEFPCEWGDDLASEHERFLVEEHFKRPVIMTNYPKAIKAFYMKIDEEESGFGGKSGQTVQGTDVLFPQIGEIIGGSVREESYDKLMGEIEARNIPMKDMNWYLDTRKYGSCPHAGFGLGFERLILFVTGMQNIRDVIPFPRTPKNAEF
jgi:asparaginyl-tRNA synthetase